MSSTIHIPVKEAEANLSGWLDKVRAGDEIILDGDGEAFRISRWAAHRTLSEVLADPTMRWSDHTLDDEWSSDLQAIIKENRSHDRDVWAE